LSADAACASRAESAPAPWALRNFIRQKLRANKSVQRNVFGLVDDTHPVSAKFFHDAVVGNGLADHCAEILGAEAGSFNESAKKTALGK
jgi:hypothetical protein